MQFSGITKLIENLEEQTTAADSDYMVIGGSDAKKIKWSTIWGLIRTKLGIGTATLTTTQKTVKEAINELNTKMVGIKGLIIQKGTCSYSSVDKQSYKDISVAFSKAFNTVPIVIVGMRTNSNGYGMGNVTAVVKVDGRSTTGFVVRVYNNDTATRSPNIDWIAVGQ